MLFDVWSHKIVPTLSKVHGTKWPGFDGKKMAQKRHGKGGIGREDSERREQICTGGNNEKSARIYLRCAGTDFSYQFPPISMTSFPFPSHSHSRLKLQSYSHIFPSNNSRIPPIPTRQLK